MTGPREATTTHDGITRRELLKTRGRRRVGAGATAATPTAAGARARARREGRRGRGHERARLHDRPAAGDPALPARLGEAQHARPDAPAEARPDLRQRVHQRVHVLAGALDADDRLLPGPARRQVHARDRHAGAASTRRSSSRPRSRTRRRVVAAAGYTPVYKGKFHCNKPANGSTWVPADVNQYGFTRWDPPDAGANQDTAEEGGGSYDNDGRFMNSQGTPADGHRGRAPVPELGRRAAAAVLHGRLARQPARRARSTRRRTRAPATTRPGSTARSSRRRRSTRTSRPSRRCRRSSCGCSTRRARSPRREMKRNYLNFYGNLMKVLGRLPGEDPRHAGRRPACSTTRW